MVVQVAPGFVASNDPREMLEYFRENAKKRKEEGNPSTATVLEDFGKMSDTEKAELTMYVGLHLAEAVADLAVQLSILGLVVMPASPPTRPPGTKVQ